jgi:hypothetical protein
MAESQKKTTKKTAAKEQPETPESTGEVRATTATVTRDKDRVAMVSRRAAGTPDQTDGYEVLGE